MAKTILIADDEPDVVRMLARRLKAYGYEVIAAFDGIRAVKQANEAKPDLIILDIKMPGLDGYTVFKNLKMSVYAAFIPVIFLSALPPSQVEREAAQLGADGFIPKPYEPGEVIAKVKKILGEWTYSYNNAKIS